MEILTTRFGSVVAKPQDHVEFPLGLVGIPHLKRFILVRDPEVQKLLWLQSTRDPAWAFALIPPRLILPTYQVRSTVEQLERLQVTDAQDVDVLVSLNRTVQSITANLQAPILINRRRLLGMQLVLSDAQYSVRHMVHGMAALRRSA